MGWISSVRSKSEAVSQVLSDYRHGKIDGKRVVIHKQSLRGSQLWLLLHLLNDDGSIARSLIKLELFRKFGPGEIGNQGFSESGHPFYYECPVSWLDEVPVPCDANGNPSEHAQAWRKIVRDRAAQRNAAKAGKVGFKNGDIVQLSSRFKIRSFVLSSKQKSSWLAYPYGNGGPAQPFRIGPSALRDAQVVGSMLPPVAA